MLLKLHEYPLPPPSEDFISGHSPFESNAAHEAYEDTLVFSGSVGNISIGGDVLIDNSGKKMFKDEIMQTICKVGFNLIWI